MGASPWPILDQNGRLRWRAQLQVNDKPVPYGLAAGEASEPSDEATPREPWEVPEFTGWTIENSAIAAVAQMALIASKMEWAEECDPQHWCLDPDKQDAMVRRELDILEELMGYRDGVMSEAIAQSTGIIPYFQGLAGFTAASHPATTNLCVIALNLGQFMVMFYKDQYQRPRPSQLRPALLPSMEVPGHASYPSGHSTKSHLIANLLSVVIGNEN